MFLLSTKMCIVSCHELIKGYYAGHKTKATLLAEKFNLNIRTLNPSLNKMTHAGLLKSQVGGIDRGYIFTRDPKEITLYDIINAIEGFSYMKNCEDALHGATCAIDTCDNCILYNTSKLITDNAKEQYKKISIYDMYYNEEYRDFKTAATL